MELDGCSMGWAKKLAHLGRKRKKKKKKRKRKRKRNILFRRSVTEPAPQYSITS